MPEWAIKSSLHIVNITKSRRGKDRFFHWIQIKPVGDWASRSAAWPVWIGSHRSPIKHRTSGVSLKSSPLLSAWRGLHTCLTYIREGLITWRVGPPPPVSMFVARHMVAGAEEGAREKEPLGVHGRTDSSWCGQHFRGKIVQLYLFLWF